MSERNLSHQLPSKPADADPAAAPLIVDFASGSREMRDLLGGKGANIAEMTRVLGPALVPSGFTITTAACLAYLQARTLPKGLDDQVLIAIRQMEEHAGSRFGDAENPLLMSVRSGARESMPGMLDTVLNIGLNDETVNGLAQRSGHPRFAWDCYRRLVQMYGKVVCGVQSEQFEHAIANAKRQAGVQDDNELDAPALQRLTRELQDLYDFPQDPYLQLMRAVQAVFDSWNGERAVAYRRINRISDDWGTAVNVQQMVFGNLGQTSGSGVAFSRDELTGAPEPSGEFLQNVQGEDIVSGARTPRDLREMRAWLPEAHAQLTWILRRLERHYGDMQDTEFTVQDGRLYMLQTRNAQRPALAAVRFAVDAVEEGLLSREAAIATIDAAALDSLLHPTFDPSAVYEVHASGIAASPGAATGEIVLSAREAIEAASQGRDSILVRTFTEAEDVEGFHAAKGILTSEGGKASHAALVARGMGRPAVTGAAGVRVDAEAGTVTIGEHVLRAGDRIAIDGTLGQVTLDDVPLVAPQASDRLRTLLSWCDLARTLGVRANADTPDDVAKAVELGAEGIGLCRTEHMFLGDRQPLMAEVIMAAGQASLTKAIERLRLLQEADFEQMLRALDGRPVTIRLLDPPLHEFLPDPASLPPNSPQRARAQQLREANPMLGVRGVRLGILLPQLYEMQVQAIFAAASRVPDPHVEVMVPLVAYERELQLVRELIDRLAAEHRSVEHSVGTMIELPRACLNAGRIAHHVEFFSFGTNDLTQTTLGFSRDDIEGGLMKRYIELKVLDRSPFETLDRDGVGELISLAIRRGRDAMPKLKLGICGEHAGDPDSIDFFDQAGVDYLSCSPYRVPTARLAAAQAAIRRKQAGGESAGRPLRREPQSL